MPGPLEGIRVIDVSAILAGPLATMMLADQGADVIKIEPPGIGDLLRMSAFRRGGMGSFFANGNRGKRSIVLDLTKPAGRDVVLDLVREADVFVQNFRPGAVERLGIGEADLRAVRPDLVYVSISGYGETGPYSKRRVYDPILQALTGHVAIQKNPDVPIPDLIRHVVVDKASAYTAAQAITAALFARERGAGGQHVRIAMIDVALAFLWPDGMMKQTMLGDDVSPGPTLYELYRLTETADGHLVYFAASDKEFGGLFRALGRADLVADPRFTLFTIADDMVRLKERIIRLKDPNCHAEFPHSRTRRLVGNVQVKAVDGDSATAVANFIVYRHRRHETPRVFSGQYRYRLRRVGNEIRIAERRAVLDAEELGPMGAVSFIL